MDPPCVELAPRRGSVTENRRAVHECESKKPRSREGREEQTRRTDHDVLLATSRFLRALGACLHGVKTRAAVHAEGGILDRCLKSTQVVERLTRSGATLTGTWSLKRPGRKTEQGH